MATNTQPAAVETEVSAVGPRYRLGDFLEHMRGGDSHKVRLTACPLCATDPNRDWHEFGDGNYERPRHFHREHDPADV